MKVTVNIECSPQEARSFFGFPDMQPVHDAMMDELQKRMAEGLDMDTLMKMWMPNMGAPTQPNAPPNVMAGLNQFQNMFWQAMNAASAPTPSADAPEPTDPPTKPTPK